MDAQLDRVVRLIRTGQFAYGGLAWEAYARLRQIDPQTKERVDAAFLKRDYFRAADLIQYVVAPAT